jgi:ethanolamine utilization protein EutQ
MEFTAAEIEKIVQKILTEKLSGMEFGNDGCKETADGVIKVSLPSVQVKPEDKLDTGNPRHHVYTHDVFSLGESPRLGCGIMEMKETTFDWTLDYDEIDYVMEGSLRIRKGTTSVTAGPGEIILIPKGSSIQFSVDDWARFMYVTYPADWMGDK